VENHEKIHILLLGLDHRLLWQLTRTLAHLEDRIVIDCVKDPSAAKEICDRESVQVIVVDGWEQAWKAARHLAGDEAFEGGAWKWIIVAESLPLECLPAGRLSPSAVFLEKPFNPKDFPSFLLEVVASREIPEERELPEPLPEEISLPLTPGESYQKPEGAQPSEQGAEGTAGPGAEAEMERTEEVAEPDAEPIAEEVAESVAEPIAEPVGEPLADAFYRHVDEGFARLSEKDWNGAREQWSAALKIRPHDMRLQTNLRRLESKMKQD
jgi:hypothetical protein